MGGVAAIAWGSEQFTKDLDVAAPFTHENLERLLGVVMPLGPRFYQTLGKPRVERTAENLSHFKNLYLETSLGILDVLSEVPPIGKFQAVAARAATLVLFERPCRVIALDDLIDVKAHVARPKDKLVEVSLRAIRARMKSAI